MTTNRGTNWSITINNPTADDDENIARAKQKGWKMIGQLEKGENGTPHYQMMWKTPQVRFSAVKKAFPRGHIELARNPDALAQYVIKEDTRAGAINTTDKYPCLSKYWDLIYDKISAEVKDFAEMIDYDKLQDSKVLGYLDRATKELIYEGYFVEMHACNPQNRSSWLKFAKAIMWRSLKRIQENHENTKSVASAETPVNADGQTDRQCVDIPTINLETDSITTDGDGTEETFEGTQEDETDYDYEEGEGSQTEGHDDSTGECSGAESD